MSGRERERHDVCLAACSAYIYARLTWSFRQSAGPSIGEGGGGRSTNSPHY